MPYLTRNIELNDQVTAVIDCTDNIEFAYRAAKALLSRCSLKRANTMKSGQMRQKLSSTRHHGIAPSRLQQNMR